MAAFRGPLTGLGYHTPSRNIKMPVVAALLFVLEAVSFVVQVRAWLGYAALRQLTSSRS